MNRILITVVVVVVISGVAACTPASRTADNGVDLPDAQTRCDVDGDCVLVASACDCDNGGVVVAVARDARDDVAANLDNALCDAVVSDDPGCDADEAVCVDGTCQLSFNE